jgi:hypothetical protein
MFDVDFRQESGGIPHATTTEPRIDPKETIVAPAQTKVLLSQQPQRFLDRFRMWPRMASSRSYRPYQVRWPLDAASRKPDSPGATV